MVEAVLERGDELPPPILGDALIDTGASLTCVDLEVAQRLRLPEVGKATMASASHANHETSLYPVRVTLQGVPIEFTAERAMGASLKSQGLVALIGRDVLSNCILFYNGFTGEITFGL
jgi:predicted aspartyl protease